MYHLRREQFIPLPRNEVYAFFEKPENLALITPPSLGFLILTPSPILMKKGALIDYTIKVLGFRLHWRTEITDYDPPNSFKDCQRKGPYKIWEHAHTFVEKEGGTLMIDEVAYDLPFGWIGKIAHVFFVKKEIVKIFDFRERKIRALVTHEK